MSVVAAYTLAVKMLQMSSLSFIIGMYTPFGMIVTIHLSLKSTTFPLVVISFHMATPYLFVASPYDPTPSIPFTACQVAAALLPLLSRQADRVGVVIAER